MMAIDTGVRRTLSCSFLSLGVHGGAAAALFLGFGSNATPAQPMANMVVEIAQLPSAPPVPPSFTPPQPEQVESQPKPVVDKLKIPPLPKMVLNIKPEVAVPLKPLEEEKKVQKDKPADETTHMAAPEAPIKDAPKAPAVGAPNNTPSNAEQSWAGRVLAALERKKRYPGEAQRQRQEDAVLVRITMDRKGRVMASQIRKSRGYGMLDSEVSSLVQRASPLPAPPQEVSGDPVSVVVSVEFFIKPGRGS
jgi:periplasmic protein TonB